MENENLKLWEKVEQDQLKYKVFLTLSLITWAIAIGVLISIGYLFYLEYQQLYSQFQVGLIDQIGLNEAKKNIYMVVFSISIIVACLSSLVVLMRQRSASLHDIQMRLAIVEQHVSEQK